MNLRKFYFNLSVIVASVLFLSGIGILYYINSHLDNTEAAYASSDNPLDRIFRPFAKAKEPFNVLLLGGDRVNNLTDVIMLANFDPETMNINIMSIPRDTKVIIENKERKINYAFPHGGVELSAKTISELLDVRIKYYIFVDIAAFRKIIDLLGGVDYYIPVDLDYDDPTQNLHIHLKKGRQVLNGAQAEQYVRFRKPNVWNREIRKYYDGSDLKRTEAQQAFIRELMRQKLNIQYFPKLTSIIEAIFENVETNITLNEVIKLTGYISKFNYENVDFIHLPGTTYDASPWYYLCDVEAARQAAAESFRCGEGFIRADEDIKKLYEKENSATRQSKTKTAGNATSDGNGGKGSGAAVENGAAANGASPMENPSNADTLITGSDKDP